MHAGAGFGRLKPDVLVYAVDAVVAVADAKYKRLVNRWPERPQGVDRADLYQLTSYLARYSPHGEALGLLLYPRDPDQVDLADTEARGPWQTESGAGFASPAWPSTRTRLLRNSASCWRSPPHRSRSELPFLIRAVEDDERSR